VREFRSSGVQEFRSSGVQEFRSSGVQEFRSSGVQEFRAKHKFFRKGIPKSDPTRTILPASTSFLRPGWPFTVRGRCHCRCQNFQRSILSSIFYMLPPELPNSCLPHPEIPEKTL
jgi:hypothetical protein